MNEFDIKRALISYLCKLEGSPSLSSEQRFAFGSRRCDLMMAKHQCLHAYEIKSDLDNFKKLMDQLADYIRTFEFTYVVTTEAMLDKLPEVPACVGVLLVNSEGIIEIAPAVRSEYISIEYQLDLLTNASLKNVFKGKCNEKAENIRTLVSQASSEELETRVRRKLVEQTGEICKMFYQEVKDLDAFSIDELSILEMRSSTIRI